MNFFNTISLRSKLIIAAVIPLIALCYYLVINLNEENRKKNTSLEVIAAVAEIDAVSKVLHEIQKERSLTFAFLSSKGAQEGSQLTEQREATDRSLFSLQQQLKENKGAVVAYAAADSLNSVRAKVNELRPINEIDGYYISFKAVLLDRVSRVLRASGGLTLKNHFEEHLFLLHAKDFLAQMRSELGGVIAAGKFEGTAYGSFASLRGKHEVNIARFQSIASPELREFFDKKYQGPFVRQTYAIIDEVFKDPSLAGIQYKFGTWWEPATSSINALKEVEDFSSVIIKQKADNELSSAYANLRFNIILAALVTVLLILIVASTISGVVSSINKIKAAAERMAKGDVNIALDIKTRDEIGDLAHSFNQMIAETKNFSQIANTIGKGDYSPVVKIRGQADALGIALDTMKTNLKQLSKENEMRTWLLKGNSDLNDKIRGEKDVRSLAQDAIIQISNYLNAQIGAIYIASGNSLSLVGSYAFQYRKDNANTFAFGQGLVGQSALEKKPILFREVPPDYIRIQSGLGNTVPKSIIVYPFLYGGEVKGVIEIGSAQEFTDLELEFLEMVAENLAIAFNGAQSRTKLKDLLEETQRQAEELEAQQEELKQSNEELQEKTVLLERSEAELKAQQEELQQTNEELEEKANLLEEQKEKLENSKIDIENKARELEVTSRYKSEFLANMSHELRTPLNSILILSQLLSDNKSKSLNVKEVEFARNIYNSGADLLNLINEILDLSKVESGRMDLEIAPITFNEIEEDLRSMFSEVAKNKAIEFTIENKVASAEQLVSDKQRLEQILRNLLSNAFKFTSKGGKVGLIIEKASPGLAYKSKSLLHQENVLAFKVIDTGIGIPEHKQGIIFEAFQQADGSTKRRFGGTGLGLSISRELANVLGGEIQVKSGEGEGSTFTLFMPANFDASIVPVGIERKVDIKPANLKPTLQENKITKFPVEEGELIDDRDQISGNDKVVLIMEDDSQFSQMLLDFVRDRNYKGIVAARGNTGLSYARHFKPDAILLDMKLPVMDGAEVLRHLKNDPDLRHIPVQIISGYDMKRESLELGAFNFIQKPISKEQLNNSFEKIEEFLSRKLKKLLVVEDNENQNKAIRELIGNGDVKSYSAFSGHEAHQMMMRDHYDCVIVDLGLPDMSGFDLLEKIRGDERLNKVPIVVYTGKDLTKDENARLLRFANTVVLKTADSQERLLDETMLFLHRVEAKLPKEKQDIIRNLHKTNEVLHGRKVLVVDDDIRNIYSLTNVLEEEGMNCLTAENGKIAIKMLKENSDIDIVLMDIMMPEMDGFDATVEIRKINKFSKLPIVALTAKAMKGDREKCLNAGMSDYIAKPVNIEQLLSLLRVWLYK